MDKTNLKTWTVYDLAMRLNMIMVEQQKLDLEHNAIVQELWDRIPSVTEHPDIQPKIRKRVPPKLPPGTPDVKLPE